MLSFSSVKVYEDRDSGESQFRVQTSKCWYQVRVNPETVWITGPGVDELYERDEDLPPKLSHEGLALAAVIYFEEQE